MVLRERSLLRDNLAETLKTRSIFARNTSAVIPAIADQYACRPSGSTTAALIHWYHCFIQSLRCLSPTRMLSSSLCISAKPLILCVIVQKTTRQLTELVESADDELFDKVPINSRGGSRDCRLRQSSGTAHWLIDWPINSGHVLYSILLSAKRPFTLKQTVILFVCLLRISVLWLCSKLQSVIKDSNAGCCGTRVRSGRLRAATAEETKISYAVCRR